MFTGIVQAKVKVAAIERNDFGIRLTVDRAAWGLVGGYVPATGDSICVSGVCLTIAGLTDAMMTFDVIAETLSKTTLGELAVESEVNLEPAVLPNQPLGGHFMQGHVDGVGEVTDVHAGDDEWRITIRPSHELMDYIIPKGSIAVDGVSLTLAANHENTFGVALIPTTLDVTTLGKTKVGNRVNLECDILAKTVVHALKRRGGGAVTMDLLREAGFVD